MDVLVKQPKSEKKDRKCYFLVKKVLDLILRLFFVFVFILMTPNINYIAFLVGSLHIFLIYFLLRWCFKHSQNSKLKKYFWYAVILKISGGFALGLIYVYFFKDKGGDTLAFFRYGQNLVDIFYNSPSNYFSLLKSGDNAILVDVFIGYGENNPRAFFMFKISSLLSIFTFGNYWLMATYCSLFSFWGMWLSAKSLVAIFPKTDLALFISFFVFPSIIFWTSGLLKESIAIGIIHALLAFCLNILIHKKVRFWYFVLIPVFLWLLWRLKYYYFALTVFCLFAFIVTFLINKKYNLAVFKQTLLWFATAFSLLLLAPFIHSNLSFDAILWALTQSNQVMASQSPVGNIIHYINLQENIWSFILNAPLAIFAVFFRPFIGEGGNVFKLFMGVENLFILLLFFNLILKKYSKKAIKKHFPILLTAFVYIILTGILLAFAAPNFGALARYKMAFLPFLIYILISQTKKCTFFKFLY